MSSPPSPLKQKKKNLKTPSRPPTSKFSEDDFKEKVKMTAADQRRLGLAKIQVAPKNKLPSEWTRAELIEKISITSRFSQDKVTNLAEIVVTDGNKIKPDDWKYYVEVFKRITEIYSVSLTRSNLTSSLFGEVLFGLSHLRHLKELYIDSNNLESSTIDDLINFFTQSRRKLEVLSIQNNPKLTFQDGFKLFDVFSSLTKFNRLNLSEFVQRDKFTTNNRTVRFEESEGSNKAEEEEDEKEPEFFDIANSNIVDSLTLFNCEIKLLELGFICGFLSRNKNIKKLHLKNNKINSECLIHLVQYLQTKNQITYLDLRQNPLSQPSPTQLINYSLMSMQEQLFYQEPDKHGLNYLLHYVQSETNLLNIDFSPDSITIDNYLESINRSLSVNRSIHEDQGVSDLKKDQLSPTKEKKQVRFGDEVEEYDSKDLSRPLKNHDTSQRFSSFLKSKIAEKYTPISKHPMIDRIELDPYIYDTDELLKGDVIFKKSYDIPLLEMNDIDEEFIKKNHIPQCSLALHEDRETFSIKWEYH